MFEKFKGFIRSTKGKIACAAASCAATLGSTVTAFAAEDTAFVEGIKSIWTEVTKQINITNIVSIIVIVLGTVIGLGLFWFGARYVLRKITGAAKKGKISV